MSTTQDDRAPADGGSSGWQQRIEGDPLVVDLYLDRQPRTTGVVPYHLGRFTGLGLAPDIGAKEPRIDRVILVGGRWFCLVLLDVQNADAHGLRFGAILDQPYATQMPLWLCLVRVQRLRTLAAQQGGYLVQAVLDGRLIDDRKAGGFSSGLHGWQQ